jgi:hypothetical protein
VQIIEIQPYFIGINNIIIILLRGLPAERGCIPSSLYFREGRSCYTWLQFQNIPVPRLSIGRHNLAHLGVVPTKTHIAFQYISITQGSFIEFYIVSTYPLMVFIRLPSSAAIEVLPLTFHRHCTEFIHRKTTCHIVPTRFCLKSTGPPGIFHPDKYCDNKKKQGLKTKSIR